MIKIYGNKNNQDFLKKNLEDGVFPHAYLFRGARHLGKKTLARQFAESIINSKDINIHPDVMILESGEDEMIKKVREIRKKIYLSPQRASRKIVLCYNVDRMRLDALNTFLKSLEEPLPDVIFILTASREILSTVESRCVVLKFFPLSNRLMREVVKKNGISEDMSELVLRFSMGRPGLIYGFNKDLLNKKLSDLLNSNIGDLLDFAEKISPQKGKTVSANTIKNVVNKSVLVPAGASANAVAKIHFLLYNWIGEAREMMLSEVFTEKKKSINLLKELLRTYELISMPGANIKLILENLFLTL